MQPQKVIVCLEIFADNDDELTPQDFIDRLQKAVGDAQTDAHQPSYDELLVLMEVDGSDGECTATLGLYGIRAETDFETKWREEKSH